MTNYVTGKMATVQPEDWMKIGVGGVIGAITLQDLKNYIGQSNSGNSGNSNNLIAVKDVTVDWASSFKVGKEISIPLTITPIGATAPITVTYVDGNGGSVKNVTYDPSTRLITATGVSSSPANIHVTWDGGKTDLQIPVEADSTGNSGSGGNSGGNSSSLILHPNLELNADPQTLTSSEFDSNGFAISSREDGSYGGGVVTSISGQNINDFDLNYNDRQYSYILVKPLKTGLITSTQDVIVTIKKDDEVRQVTFHVTV